MSAENVAPDSPRYDTKSRYRGESGETGITNHPNCIDKSWALPYSEMPNMSSIRQNDICSAGPMMAMCMCPCGEGS